MSFSGYLTCALFFDNSHEFVMLLINTIQKVRHLPCSFPHSMICFPVRCIRHALFTELSRTYAVQMCLRYAWPWLLLASWWIQKWSQLYFPLCKTVWLIQSEHVPFNHLCSSATPFYNSLWLLREVVRRRAVMCIHRFHQIAPGNIQQPLIYKALCDKHPSVMWAALYVYQDLVKVPSVHSYFYAGLPHSISLTFDLVPYYIPG